MASQAFPPTDLEQSILRTLCWFSISGRPVTAFEIWKWLIDPARAYDVSEVHRVLEGSEWVKGRCEKQKGFYRIINGVPCTDFENAIETRSKNYVNAVKKFHKLRRAMKYFRLFSSVYAVGAVNSIAWWNTNEQSDIDLFVITKPGSIWSTRFWMVLPFILFGVRPGASKQDPFCFSFFVSHDALALEHLRFKEGDHEFTFWLKSLVPLFDRGNEFRALTHANPWANHVLPNVSSRCVHPLHQSSSPFPSFPSFSFLEPLYRSIQRKRFPLAIRQLENKDSRVVINDQLLKFHVTDRRVEFEKTYQELIQKMIA